MTDFEEAVLTIFQHQFDSLYQHIPAKVLEYDEKTQFAKVQPLIDIDGVKLNPIPAVPVQHIGSQDFVVVMEIKPGTTGMLQVCMRDMGVWLFNNKKQSNRKFSLTDTTFSPGYRSKSDAIPNLVNDGIQLRSFDGERYIWMKRDGKSYFSDECHFSKRLYSKGELVTTIKHTHPYIDSKGSSATPVDSDTDEAEQDV